MRDPQPSGGGSTETGAQMGVGGQQTLATEDADDGSERKRRSQNQVMFARPALSWKRLPARARGLMLATTGCTKNGMRACVELAPGTVMDDAILAGRSMQGISDSFEF